MSLWRSVWVDQQFRRGRTKMVRRNSAMSSEAPTAEIAARSNVRSCCASAPWPLLRTKIPFCARSSFRVARFVLVHTRCHLGCHFWHYGRLLRPFLPAYRRSTCLLVFISMSSLINRAILASRRSCCSRSSSRNSRIWIVVTNDCILMTSVRRASVAGSSLAESSAAKPRAAGSKTAFAKRYKVDRTRVNRILSRQLRASEAIAKALGLRRAYIAD